MSTQSAHRRRAHCVALIVLAALACSDSTGPASQSDQFGSPLSVGEFAGRLSGSPRVEIKLLAGTLVAREIEVEPDDAEEQVASRVTAIDPVAGTITLELGGLIINYGSSTRFRTPDESNVGRATWEAAIAAALGSGPGPWVEARRNPGAVPQSPDDPSFTALDLRLESEVDEPKIEIYLSAANFETVATPPPVARVRVLGLTIEITGTTQLVAVNPPGQPPTGIVEFEGRIASVSESAGTFTLVGGTIVQVGSATFDPGGDLVTIAATAAAVGAGSDVRVEGRGSVATAGPPAVINATTVKVEVDN